MSGYQIKELEHCRDAIAAFDKTLQDIRKFGFSLVTILLGTSGFLFTKGDVGTNPAAIVSVYAALLVLIYVLFSQDRVQQIFIRSAVLRAMELEEALGMNVTFKIAYWSERIDTATWGFGLYMVFCGANAVLTVAALNKHMPAGQDFAVWSIGCVLIAALAVFRIWVDHYSAVGLRISFKKTINELAEKKGLQRLS